MKVTCDGCHTIYDLPEGKEGQMGCPYCEHVNRPDQPGPAKESVPFSHDDVLDHSKTMLGPMDGSFADETTAVRQAVAGRMIGLSPDHDAALIILEGDGKGKRIALKKSQIVLGRKQADVVLTDPEASRRHCALLIYGDFAVVKDMGSANGTKVNDRLVKEGLLKIGNTIQIGTTVFQFMLSPKAAQPPGPPKRNA
jgi:hypothetical protein